MTPDRHPETPEIIKAERDRLMEIVTALGAVSASPGTTQALMDDTVSQVMHLTRASGAVVELVDGDELEYRAASGIVAGYLGMRLKAATSLSGLAVAQKRVLYSHDTATDPRVDLEACRKIGARSMMVVPLMRGAEAVGVLKAMSALPSAFDQIDEYALALFAQFIGGVVARQAETDRSAQLAADMERRALSDDLTKLPNRAAWNEALQSGIARAMRTRAPLAVMYLDLNGFKAVNDRHGHAAGDAVLKAFAAQLRGCMRLSDFVARLAGDEFVVLVEGLEDVERDVPIVVSKVIDAVRAGTPWEETRLVCLPSVGVAYQNGPGYDAGTLMHHADDAMYRAKNGRTMFTVADCTGGGEWCQG
jgi:diguanylate cyclase (GGDEF)-like protein